MVAILEVKEDTYLPAIRQLFQAYTEELAVDLAFQNFEDELRNPFKKYGPPGGALFIALVENIPAGCIALQKINETTCEMKRLFVHPGYRHLRIGNELVKTLLAQSKKMGYEKMVLDTLDRLQPAIHLYWQHGFVETTAYYHNPLPGVVYMEKVL